ncbi:MAG: ATP-dependent sacrificial sulfur transferase LarE [Lachnospiraceae bacterium]|nr:ATP-dependent sacrificial sulfur transferase LarE [Lachnospiraceae bacterium]
MNFHMDCINRKLESILREGDCCVAFSAGVDSTLVLKLACEEAVKLGREVYAVTFHTMLHPKADMELAMELAEAYGAKACTLQVDEYEISEILDNPPDRCFYCKDYLFRTLRAFAQEKGCASVLDGTNADDLKVFRPGLLALRKNGIVSPLAECGITKAQVRSLAASLNLETASKPSTPCLATRLPYGDRLDRELLKRIEAGEAYMKSLGFHTSRLRVHGTVVRIEVEPEQFGLLASCREELIRYLKKLGFAYITLDLQGLRSGSMDEVLSEKIKASLKT